MAHRGVQRLWAFFQSHGTGSGNRLVLGMGYHFRGDISIEIDFLLNLEFYA